MDRLSNLRKLLVSICNTMTILKIILTIIVLAPQALWLALAWENAKDWWDGDGTSHLIASAFFFAVWGASSMAIVWWSLGS